MMQKKISKELKKPSGIIHNRNVSSISTKDKGLRIRVVTVDHPILTEKDMFANNLLIALSMAARNSYNVSSDESDSSESIETEGNEEEEKQASSISSAGFNLNACSAREYIQKTVAWPLLLAMASLEKERPDNPIEFIAAYLLFYKNELEEEEKRKKEILKIKPNLLSYYKQMQRNDLRL